MIRFIWQLTVVDIYWRWQSFWLLSRAERAQCRHEERVIRESLTVLLALKAASVEDARPR